MSFHNKTTPYGNDGLPLLIPLQLHQYSINTPCWTAQFIGTEYRIRYYQYIMNTTRNILEMWTLCHFITKPHHFVMMVYQYWFTYNSINIQPTNHDEPYFFTGTKYRIRYYHYIILTTSKDRFPDDINMI